MRPSGRLRMQALCIGLHLNNAWGLTTAWPSASTNSCYVTHHHVAAALAGGWQCQQPMDAAAGQELPQHNMQSMTVPCCALPVCCCCCNCAHTAAHGGDQQP